MKESLGRCFIRKMMRSYALCPLGVRDSTQNELAKRIVTYAICQGTVGV